MKLRVRIVLIVCICFLVFAALLVLDGRTREAGVQSRLRATVAMNLETAWRGVLATERQRLLRFVDRIRSREAVTSAILKGDIERFRQATIETRTRLRTAFYESHLQLIGPDGVTRFATTQAANGRRAGLVLDRPALQRIKERAQTLDGLFQHRNGRAVYAVAVPILSSEGIGGILVLYTQVSDLVAELAEVTGTQTLIRTHEGDVLGAAKPWHARLVHDSPDLADVEGAQVATREIEGRDIQVATLPLRGPVSSDLGAVAAFRNVTDQTRQRELISRVSYFGLACTLVLFLAFVNWYLRYSFRPLNDVIRSLNALSTGRTDISVQVPTHNDEIARLAGTFESFRKGIQAREQLQRLHQELEVAERIQQQYLPTHFPANHQLEFAATMQAAREVGGDFYDVFTLHDGRIGIVIADVSDKGMGAALFMVAARTVIRSLAALTSDPADCFTRANRLLAEDNDTMMFVTAFYAVLTPETGHVTYCCAGHNPPVRRSASGATTWLPTDRQPALGVLDGAAFTSQSLTLSPDELLFFYTDGVTEATSESGEMFDEAGLTHALAGTASSSAQEDVARVLSAVGQFTEGAKQHDDMTCLAVRYAGADPRQPETSDASSRHGGSITRRAMAP
jgi:HAMP domain-containing protein